jgi:hypothetical protein
MGFLLSFMGWTIPADADEEIGSLKPCASWSTREEAKPTNGAGRPLMRVHRTSRGVSDRPHEDGWKGLSQNEQG